MLRDIGRIILIGLILLFVLFVLWQCVSNRSGGGGISGLFGGNQEAEIPLDLKQIIPASWTVLPDRSATCDYDGDGEAEWLIIYRYNQTSDPPAQTGNASSSQEGQPQFSPIGGVIYDAQVNRVPQNPSIESPYRPALLIPYKLLPDIYAGKGQGYLGESDVQVYTYPPPPSNAKDSCIASEINLVGYSGNPYFTGGPPPTRLSIFRWFGDSAGYAAVHFVGNAQVKASPAPTGPITEAVTYNRLNDRSVLCAVQTFTRPAGQGEGAPPGFEFTEQAALYTIDFCFSAPGDPAYPEGVVVALLRGNNPDSAGANATPTGNSYLTANAAANLPPGLTSLGEANRTEQYPILSITLPGTLGGYPAVGYPCPSAGVGTPPPTTAQTSQGSTPAADVWWCAREQAQVTTQVLVDGRARQVTWSLISMASEQTTADVSWRIDKVEMH